MSRRARPAAASEKFPTGRKFGACCGWSRTTQPRSGFSNHALSAVPRKFVVLVCLGVFMIPFGRCDHSRGRSGAHGVTRPTRSRFEEPIKLKGINPESVPHIAYSCFIESGARIQPRNRSSSSPAAPRSSATPSVFQSATAAPGRLSPRRSSLARPARQKTHRNAMAVATMVDRHLRCRPLQLHGSKTRTR